MNKILEVSNIYELKDLKPKDVKEIIIVDTTCSLEELCNEIEKLHEKIKVINLSKEAKAELQKRNTYQGFNRSILNKVKQICELNLNKDDLAVDMTIGNGHDTLMLCKLSKFVYGFDIQKEAIDNTTKLLNENNVNNYKLFLESHEHINELLNCKVSLILFNLGYLPGKDKKVMTKTSSTLNALKRSFEVLKDKGLILIVCYPHEEGVKEARAIKKYLNQNMIAYEEYHNTDNINAPYLMVINN